ncbi:MAG: methionyl-tRNA formyltransferase [Paludisphaera borealis]|uniref:methionyl-tRNA formyltransferase n=1 Tax=Paludisphaera borealis TaxID=1387353 RepID=UPI002841E75F|nr:methionyl-tRNA formyltransferase [Paludisphaera borealis]MDR3618179.1 methionyl-tRNA formyltransferase [Paludisphaera borealis]
MATPIAIVMLGTGDFALPLFESLHGAGHRLLSLVTQPDRPQGRHQELIPSLIKQSALRLGVPVFQPEKVNEPEAVAAIRELAPDLLVTAAYGQILSPELLGVARLGAINLHGSILPSYRGAAPVARAIERGETEAGVTVIQMTPKIDAGGMIAIARTPIDPDETAGELEDRLARLGAPLTLDVIEKIIAGRAEILPQDGSLVTKAPKLRKESGVIDWTRPALDIHNLVRAMQPWPIASTTWTALPWTPAGPLRVIVHKTRPVEGEGEPGVVLSATQGDLVVAAGQGAIQLLIVQIPGKKPMTAAEFLRGRHVQPGDQMGDGSKSAP